MVDFIIRDASEFVESFEVLLSLIPGGRDNK